ncbi:MAG TPA: FmdB family zinc ribbon protein [Bryobacteraceae bacterium]|nr:FmdB family zinc ribbon protein [Bryobacteraceae bacterium]
MPLYEYQCEQCGDIFEVMQKFADAPLTTHAKCGGSVHRLLSAPALQFKGSGWYITDYAKSGSKSSSSGKGDEANGKKSAESPAKSDTSAPSTTPAPAASDTK